MGLLDDAIREHLDLKRRRGADPAEIERAEHEALGPVRRGPEDLEPTGDDSELDAAGSHHEAPGDSPLDYSVNGEDHLGDSFDEETELFGEERAPAFGHVPPSVEPEQHLAKRSDEPLEEDEFATRRHDVAEPSDAEQHVPEPPAGAPEPAPEAPPPHRDPHRGEETAEYDVEQEMENQAEDVLEETPEFLQTLRITTGCGSSSARHAISTSTDRVRRLSPDL